MFPAAKARGALLAAAVCLLWAASGSVAWAYTPESPEVKALLTKAFAYLDASGDHNQLGGKCLVGLCYLKRDGHAEHPRVKHAIETCQRVCKRPSAEIRDSIYSIGIALVFLCEVDPSVHREEIQKLIEVLDQVQKEHGGWGYPPDHKSHGDTGDTSMTQYGVLGTWAAVRTGVVSLPKSSTEKVTNWLLRTQDPEGGWGYQGNDPGPKQPRVGQAGVTPTLSAAALGSVYMAADLLRLVEAAQPDEVRLEGLPAAVRLKKDEKKEQPLTKEVELNRLKDTLRMGNGWFARNYKIEVGNWQYYYLYALERYQSFRELVERRSEKEPRWYNDGVVLLRKQQAADGSWDNGGGPAVDTAFGILFLLRSTKKIIEKTKQIPSEGVLVGGRGLPGDLTNVQIRGGRVVPAASAAADALLTALEDEETTDLDDLALSAEQVELSDDPETRRRQLARFAQLTAAGPRPIRLAAVRALGRGRSLAHVRELIAVVRDPDAELAEAAHIALRQVSRKLNEIELPTDATMEQRQAAAARWEAWRRTLQVE